MSTTNTLPAPNSPKNKLETAIANYLNALAQGTGSGSPLYRLTFYPAQSSAERTLPACIVYCEEATETAVNSNVYRGRWFVYPWTQKDDDNNPTSATPTGAPPAQTPAPEVVHDERLSAIQEALRDSAPVMAAVNYGSSTRTVPSFHLYGFYEAHDQHADRVRAFGDALCYEGGFAGFSVK